MFVLLIPLSVIPINSVSLRSSVHHAQHIHDISGQHVSKLQTNSASEADNETSVTGAMKLQSYNLVPGHEEENLLKETGDQWSGRTLVCLRQESCQ